MQVKLDVKRELGLAIQKVLDDEKMKEESVNSKKPVKRRGLEDENIIFTSYPVGSESS